MRVAVIGAGMIGVTTAYELAADGHEVTVFERRGSVAAESSFANAGLVAPGYVAPWAAPGMPGKVLRHLLRRACAGALRRPPRRRDARLARGAGGAPAGPPVYRANRARMHRLAQFSRERLHELIAATAPRLRARRRLPRPAAHAARTSRSPKPGIAALAELGAAPSVLDAAGCRGVEPGLNPDDRAPRRHLLEGRRGRQLPRVRAPAAQGGGARSACASASMPTSSASSPARGPRCVVTRRAARPRATRPLRSRATPSDWPPTAARRRRDRRAELRRRRRLRRASARGRCCGRSACTCRCMPVYGYSVTAPLRHDEQHLHLEPRAALMDERYKVAISRARQPRARRRQRRDRRRRRARTTSARRRRSTRCSTTGFPASRGAARRSAGKARGRCCPTARRCSARAAPTASGSTSATAAAAGRSPAARRELVADAVAGRATPIEIDGLGIERLRRMSRDASASTRAIGRRPLHGVAATRTREARGARRASPPVRADGARRRGGRAARAGARAARAQRRRLRRAGQQRRRRHRGGDATARDRARTPRSCSSANRRRLPPTPPRALERARRRRRRRPGLRPRRVPRRGAGRPAPISSSTPSSASASSRPPEAAMAAAIDAIARLRGARRPRPRRRRAFGARRRPRPAARRGLRQRRRHARPSSPPSRAFSPAPGATTPARIWLADPGRRRRRRRHAGARLARRPRRPLVRCRAAPPVAAQGQLRRRRDRRRRARHGRRGAGSPRAPRTPPAPAACSSTCSAPAPRPALPSTRCRPELMLRAGWWQGDAERRVARRPSSAAAAAATRCARSLPRLLVARRPPRARRRRAERDRRRHRRCRRCSRGARRPRPRDRSSRRIRSKRRACSAPTPPASRPTGCAARARWPSATASSSC